MRDETTCEIKIGHAIERLREIETETVDTVITSPPYWGLRDYKTEPVVFGRDKDCCPQEDDCIWMDPTTYQRRSNDDGKSEKQASNQGANNRDDPITFTTCSKCGAWKGQLGLEQSPEQFVEHLVEIFEECRRILKPTGTLWVNLGDSYMSKGSTTNPEQYGLQKHRDEAGKFRPKTLPDGYKEKDLVGLPWLFAFAARKAGWYLRNDIVWAKSISGPHYRGGVSMPEPVQDRCTRSHEFFFHFSKSRRYYYDIQSYAEPLECDEGVRNMRTVWHFNPQPFPGAHFAVYPKHLIEPIIRASSSHTCCGGCGVPWVRRQPENQFTPDCECHGKIEKLAVPTVAAIGEEDNDRTKNIKVYVSDLDLLDHPTQPSVIVDPFSGSGTTGIVALENGRSYIGIELNEEYAELSLRRFKQERTGLTVGKFRESAVDLKEYW